MLFPVVPVAILAGLGAIAYVITRPKTDPNAEPIPGGGAVGPQGSTPTMSPQMRQAFQALLAGSDPNAMDTTASALEPFGFLQEAAQLRAQAGALRARTNGVQELPPLTRPPAAQPPAAQPPAAQPPAAKPPAATIPIEPTLPGTSIPVPPAALPSFARVTTSQPAPEGDLMIRPAPNAPGTPGVGPEKNGIVTVINKDVLGDGQWTQIVWAGGPRRGPVSGFVPSKFLTPSAVGPLGTAIAGSRNSTICVAPSGCRLRKSPTAVSEFRAIVGNGETVTVEKVVAGPKRESFSPGKGGWVLVRYKNLQGWLPLEWLVKA